MQEETTQITRILNGDIEAFEELVEEYKHKLFSFLVKMTYSTHDAEEILQEVFIRVYNNIDKYDDRWMFSTWIYRIAINAYRSYMKNTKRLRTVPIDAFANMSVSAEGNPEDVYEILGQESNPEEFSLYRPNILSIRRKASKAEI
mgnify:CR=1 FL=1